MKSTAFILALAGAMSQQVAAQDPDPFFTARMPVLLDPSRSGSEKGLQAGLGHVAQRDQLTGAFRTQLLATEYGFRDRDQARSWMGAALIIGNDRSSTNSFRTVSVGVSPAVHVRTSQRSFLSMGFGAQWTNRTYGALDGEWGSQYNGRFYDPNIDPGESWNRASNSVLDLRVGGSWTMKAKGTLRGPASHNVLVLGVSVDHLSPVLITSDGGSIPIAEQRRSVQAITEFPVAILRKGFLAIDAAAHQQGEFTTGRINVMLGRRIIEAVRLSDNSSPIGFKAGIGYRYNEAVLLNASVDWWMLTFGAAYGTSITNSAERIAGRRIGELFLQFRPGGKG